MQIKFFYVNVVKIMICIKKCRLFGKSIISAIALFHSSTSTASEVSSNQVCNSCICLPFEESCNNYQFHADFLYWIANEDGLEYGTKMVSTPIAGQPVQTSMQLLDLHFQWDPGFCIGAA